jgi:hypothetical protein
MSLERTTPTLPVELLAQIILEAAADDMTVQSPPSSCASHSVMPALLARWAMQAARRCIERNGSLDLFITIKIVGNFWPRECYQNYEMLVRPRCMEYIDHQRGPIEMLASSDGNHLARWCRLDLRVFITTEYQQKLTTNEITESID